MEVSHTLLSKGTYIEVGDDVLRFGTSSDLVDVVHGLLKLVLLARSNIDLGAILSEASRHHLADTRAASSDKDDLSLDAEERRESQVIEVNWDWSVSRLELAM